MTRFRGLGAPVRGSYISFFRIQGSGVWGFRVVEVGGFGV